MPSRLHDASRLIKNVCKIELQFVEHSCDTPRHDIKKMVFAVSWVLIHIQRVQRIIFRFAWWWQWRACLYRSDKFGAERWQRHFVRMKATEMVSRSRSSAKSRLITFYGLKKQHQNLFGRSRQLMRLYTRSGFVEAHRPYPHPLQAISVAIFMVMFILI